MAIPAMLMAGSKALPAIGAAALKYLPAIGAVGGAAPGVMRGNLGQAVSGGLMGGLSTWGLGAPVKGLTNLGAAGAARAVGASGIGAQQGLSLAQNLANQEVASQIAGAAIPVVTGLAVGNIGSGLTGGAQQVGGIGTGIAANQLAGGGPPNFTNQNMMSALPGGFNYNVNPYGQIGDVINPAGALQSGRLNRLYDYDTTVRGMHKIMPAMRMYSEQAKKDDMSRQLAADQLRSNIVQAAQMGLNAQTAGLNQGTTAMNQIGNALTTQYRY